MHRMGAHTRDASLPFQRQQQQLFDEIIWEKSEWVEENQ